MNLFNKVKEKRNLETYTYNPVLGTFNTGVYSDYKTTKAMKLATVYRCVTLISSTFASLEILPYTIDKAGNGWKNVDYVSNLYNLLNVQPNKLMNSFAFKQKLVVDILLSGNAYVLIQRDKTGAVIELTLLNPYQVTVKVNSGDIKYEVRDSISGKIKNTYSNYEIAHITNYSEDGVVGKSVLDNACDVLGIAYDSEKSAKNWFTGFVGGILTPKVGVRIGDDQSIKAKADFQKSVADNPNGVTVLADAFEYQRLSQDPKTSQLLESRNFNQVMIASFFNVPPSLVFAQDQKFSTSEQESLSFLNNCIQPMIERIEAELFRKIYLPSEWNTSDLKANVDNLYRLDAAARADYYTKMFAMGVYTTNEIRAKLYCDRPVVGGNRAFTLVNYQPLDNLISEQVVSSDNSKQLDNKIK